MPWWSRPPCVRPPPASPASSSSVCTDRYAPLQRLWRKSGSIVVSNFNDRPSKLFDGLEHARLSIVLFTKGVECGENWSTTYNKWSSEERPFLFSRLAFVKTTRFSAEDALAKLGSSRELSIIEKYLACRKTLADYVTPRREWQIYYTRKLSHFLQVLDFIPEMRDEKGRSREPSELKIIRFASSSARDVFLALLNSSLFYWTVTVFSDCRNLNRREIESARFELERAEKNDLAALSELSRKLMDEIRATARTLTMRYKNFGAIQIQTTYPKLSKSIIDTIDLDIARHYGLSDEETDFIINYDTKYRMGTGGGEDEG